jgi:arylsulfatase
VGPDDIQRDVLPIPDIHGARKFTGEVKWVELDVGLDDHNHMIAPEDRVSLAMGLQ